PPNFSVVARRCQHWHAAEANRSFISARGTIIRCGWTRRRAGAGTAAAARGWRHGMLNFAGKLAVVTGGGSGMGRELVRRLVAAGCDVAMCDLSAASMAETRDLSAKPGLSRDIRITSYVADVSDEAQVLRFREALTRDHATDKLELLFNNAGIGGGGSLFSNSRAQWERTFNICWGGVYFCTRAFLPMLVKADAAHIVNTSSVNGFWASLGPNVPH